MGVNTIHSVIAVRTTNKNADENSAEEKNIHKSFRFLFVIAQTFGLFPLRGVFISNTNSLQFTWTTLLCLNTCLTIFGASLIVLGHISMIGDAGYEQFQINGVIFNSCGALTALLSIKMARDWPIITQKWKDIDDSMISYGWPRRLDVRLKIIAGVFLILELIEHGSIQTNKLMVAINCRGSLEKGFEHFSVNMSFAPIFRIIDYSPYLGIMFQIINTRLAFAWTFLDLFIILISCSLSMRFRQINERVLCMRNMKIYSEKKWEIVSEDYNRLCRLCQFLDGKMSLLVMLSFFTNIYFITFQVFGAIDIQTMTTTLEKVYYFISLGLLVLRIVSVCIYGSWIIDESKISLYLLMTTPQEIVNKEILRFVERVKYQPVGLTGNNIFRITKKMILKITSAVVTYELVVIQFNNRDTDKQEVSKNSMC